VTVHSTKASYQTSHVSWCVQVRQLEYDALGAAGQGRLTTSTGGVLAAGDLKGEAIGSWAALPAPSSVEVGHRNASLLSWDEFQT
jgi:hypothetical protein